MRRSTSLLITLVALCGSMIAASPSVVAQGPSADSPCVGSWMWRVTPLGQPEFTAYAMFLADGGFHTERAPVVAGPPDAPENVTFPAGGYGAWEPTESGGCAVTFVGLDTDSLGNTCWTPSRSGSCSRWDPTVRRSARSGSTTRRSRRPMGRSSSRASGARSRARASWSSSLPRRRHRRRQGRAPRRRRANTQAGPVGARRSETSESMRSLQTPSTSPTLGAPPTDKWPTWRSPRPRHLGRGLIMSGEGQPRAGSHGAEAGAALRPLARPHGPRPPR